ncbi:MAG: alpha/beta hydrolase [Thermodesulfovibrionales bacterium]|jgi:pimeloyl-ACP methyl ester carboxylesterase
MTLPYPTIVVPGITASYLQDSYPLPPETVWSVLTKDYGRIALHPNDLRYEAQEPARVRPGELYEVAYKEMVAELRYNLCQKADEPVPVYPFGYDWRMPLNMVEKGLAEFVDEVIGRTKLLRHYAADGYADKPKVNLIGHSMGGLVITGYLQSVGHVASVNKVVTLATPFQGSFEAVIKIITGTANLGTAPPSSREREAARLTPSLYELLPSFSNGLVVEDNIVPPTLFNPQAWQVSVADTIAEFIRLHGLPTADAEADARRIFADLLADAKKHRDRIDSFSLIDAGLSSAQWLAVVGVDSETRVKLKIIDRNGVPDFDLSSADRQNKWGDSDPSQQRLTGDGTVPYEGAVPKFLSEQNLVLVTPDDYGYWEIEDRVLTSVAGFHGILPNMDMLHRLMVRFLADRPDDHGNTWGRCAPGVTKWQPPLALNPKKG